MQGVGAERHKFSVAADAQDVSVLQGVSLEQCEREYRLDWHVICYGMKKVCVVLQFRVIQPLNGSFHEVGTYSVVSPEFRVKLVHDKYLQIYLGSTYEAIYVTIGHDWHSTDTCMQLVCMGVYA